MQKHLYLWVGGIGGARGLGLHYPPAGGGSATGHFIERVHTFYGPTAIEAELHSVGAILPLLMPLLVLVGIVFSVVVGTMVYNAQNPSARNHVEINPGLSGVVGQWLLFLLELCSLDLGPGPVGSTRSGARLPCCLRWLRGWFCWAVPRHGAYFTRVRNDASKGSRIALTKQAQCLRPGTMAE